MPILKLHLENVGPFDKLELDLTDGNGKAHLGPHILCGVNGSGKTTVLRTIAWCLAGADSGFGEDHWLEFLDGRENPRALIVPEVLSRPSAYPCRSIRKNLDHGKHVNLTADWVSSLVGQFIVPSGAGKTHADTVTQEFIGSAVDSVLALGCVAAYAPRQELRRLLGPPDRSRLGKRGKALSFDGTVSNDAVQAYWVDSLSKEAFHSAQSASQLRRAIVQILGEGFEPTVELNRPFIEPLLKFRGLPLNFSQLAAGFSATLGWVVDYLLRQAEFVWPDLEAAERKPGVLMIDEIETHLHPRWQRQVLNGIRAAFPNTQIIVTSHSPFVISSCPEARVHLLKLDKNGRAGVEQSIDAPAGASISANITDIFDVTSEFSPLVEGELEEWSELRRKRAARALSAEESTRFRTLAKTLALRGEEVALIVADPPALPESILEELTQAALKNR